MTLTPTRSRLRAVRTRQPAPETPPALPYTHEWDPIQADGLWTLVVRIRATGQRIPISYNVRNAPDVVDAERVAARLYGLRRLDGTR